MKGPEPVPLPYSASDLEQAVGADWPVRLQDAYRWMVFARTLDARMLALQRQGRIGFYGPATGQEAVSVAAGLVAERSDWVFPGLREQLVALVRGHPLEQYLDHLFANDRDPSRGRQMPCHPTARDVHYVSMSSVIGTQISHAVGFAYGQKLHHERALSLVFFGDGATSSNDFHAGLNLAGVLSLPVLFCLTNNQWAISHPVERQSRVARLADKAAAYGLPGQQVDGTDYVACHRAFRDALDRVRTHQAPELIEFVLYRMTPHSSSDDPKRYQAPDWMERAQAHDPVHRLDALLRTLGVLTDDRLSRLTEEAEASVKRAIQSAESQPAPDAASLTTDVFGSALSSDASHS